MPGEQLGVQDMFAAHAAAAPEAPALTCGAQTLTAGELNARANRLAHVLRDRGVGQESIVGICLDRGVDLVVSLLAVVKSGGAYVPLDPSYPATRLGQVIEDTAPRLVITDARHTGLLAGCYRGELLTVDAGDSAPASDPEPLGNPDNLMYVIHTSGSTGRPKGVCLSHGNVRRLLAVTAEHFAFGPGDTWTLFHSYAFDFSVWELWGALAHGGHLVVVPSEITRSPSDFLDLLVRHQVTVLNQTPSAFRALVAAAERGDERLSRLALRWVIFGGEKLEPGALAGWRPMFGDAGPALVNMYGITETTVHVTTHRVGADELVPSAPSLIGTGLSDLRVHVMDPACRPAADGELYVGGDGVARGYLGRPALTAQRFVPDPLGPPGARMYRTGDFARRTGDGVLEFRGRADNQVKIRGFRIELGEVEGALAGLPGVANAAVVAQRNATGDLSLGAFVTGSLSTVEIRRRLADTLPEHAVPAVITRVDALPLTPSGKVDRAALARVVPRTRPTLSSTYRPPGAETERTVVRLWVDLLGIDGLGVDDDFFELGGDSLLATRLIDNLHDEYGIAVSPLTFYRNPTPAGLARAVSPASP